jgi:hypothetical protein
MNLGPVLLSLLTLLTPAALPPSLAYATDQEFAAATRKPGGINPAEIDWRCSIMAGRQDRAYLNCPSLSDTAVKSGGADVLIKTQPLWRAPIRAYEEHQGRGRGGTGAYGPSNR